FSLLRRSRKHLRDRLRRPGPAALRAPALACQRPADRTQGPALAAELADPRRRGLLLEHRNPQPPPVAARRPAPAERLATQPYALLPQLEKGSAGTLAAGLALPLRNG